MLNVAGIGGASPLAETTVEEYQRITDVDLKGVLLGTKQDEALSVDFTGTREGPALLTGSAEEMAARIRAYREAGTEHLALDFCETDPDMAAKAIEHFEREIVPLV